MSLADELLADLDDLDDGDDEYIDNVNNADANGHAVNGVNGVKVKDEPEDYDMKDGINPDYKGPSDQEIADAKSVRHIAKLNDSDRLRDTLHKMDQFRDKPKDTGEIFGSVELDPEYQLIVEANNLTAEIDNETQVINKFCRDHYHKRFPELDSLVVNPFEYILTVQALKNELEPTKIENLEFLPPATKMVLSVTASTTQGEMLEPEELERILEACQMTMDLSEAKMKIFQYVESRMSFIAPNVSSIVGASTAAKMMGVAGGLAVLSRMPSCNVLLLGSQKRILAGLSTASSQVLPHTGFVYHSEIVQGLPVYLRRKAARQIANKLTLCARIDSCHESVDGEAGRNFLADIRKKFEKWQEPAQLKETKALPRPDDAPRQKRGGRRVRKMKEKFAVTEMRRQANRVRFGEIQEDIMQTSMGFGLGSLQQTESAGSGKVRQSAAVEKKTQVSISKRLQRNLAQMNQSYGGKSTVRGVITSGTASSVAFTPMQGIEIVNPKASEKRVVEANAKYFSAGATFFNTKKKKQTSAGGKGTEPSATATKPT